MRTPKRRLIGLATAHGMFKLFGNVLEGISQFAERRPSWRFVPVLIDRPSLQSQKLDGLLGAITERHEARILESWKQPFVDVGLMIPGLSFSHVNVDNEVVGRLAFAHFFDRGLRHFAFVGPTYGLYSTVREEAFRAATRNAGFEPHLYHIRFRSEQEFDPRRWPAERGLTNWLRKLPKPVGLFVPWDLLGFQLSEACRQLGIQIPEEIAILGVDNDELTCKLARPALSSVILPAKQVGFEAARVLDELMERRRPQNVKIELPPCGIATRASTDVLATDDAEIAAAVRYVRQNPHVPLRVADVLHVVPVGRRTLERRVRQFLGHSLGQEIVRVRLERAQKLLSTTDMSVKEVAFQSGFVNARHLAVTFRKSLGQSATELRRAARQGRDTRRPGER